MIVAITGSIGSGKSTVCRYLQTLGYHVLSADVITQELLAIGHAGYLALVLHYDILGQGESIDRKKLASIIFSDKQKKQQVEAILHTLILAEMRKQSERWLQSNDIVVWEVPLLFESGFDLFCDVTIAVVADETTMINRVMERSSMSKKEVQERLASQMSQEEKSERADYIIYNHGDLDALHQQTKLVMDQIATRKE